jgi:uncharacterized membrane protein YhaH (DUF805 family)
MNQLFEIILPTFRKYADFSTRTSRREFWSFVGFYFFLSFLAGTFFPYSSILQVVFFGLFYLLTVSAIRRLHDAGFRGWWLLLPPAAIVLLCLPSSTAENRFGPPPPPTT